MEDTGHKKVPQAVPKVRFEKTSPLATPVPPTWVDSEVMSTLTSLKSMMGDLAKEQAHFQKDMVFEEAARDNQLAPAPATVPMTLAESLEVLPAVDNDAESVNTQPFGLDPSTGDSGIYGVNALVSPWKVLE
jgi:hypothetical protein